METVNIALVGCGNISGIYLENITGLFCGIGLCGVYDLLPENAQRAARRFGVPKVYGTLDELLRDEAVDIVLNLTRPAEHHAVSLAAVRAGKHVYTEKPLSATLEQGRELLRAAAEYGVLVCGAPDTFLGSALQTARKLLDDGFIGRPVGVSAFFHSRGAESWHPGPEFYYRPGGGPVLDMAPYYLTALVHLLGGVERVGGFAAKSLPTRTITGGPRAGETFAVEVDTHHVASLQFASGVLGTALFSFDMHAATLPHIEVYGTAGTLTLPDPNFFGGDVRLYRPESGAFAVVPPLFGYAGNCRGLGLADMAKAVQTGSSPRASGELLLHVLEVLEALTIHTDGAPTVISSQVERPEPMESGGVEGIL